MNGLKSCLAIVGVLALLLIGSCVLGVGALSSLGGKILDPQSTSERVAKPEGEVKQAVYEYLSGATNGSFSERAKVEYMSDGTMRLRVGTGEPYDMTMSVAFVPDGATATKLTANYNADHLAWAQTQKTPSTNLHRCLRDDFKRFAGDVHGGRSVSALDLDDLVVRARQRSNSRSLTCDLTGTAGRTIGDYETASTRDYDDTNYTPPPPAFGKPDARMGKPTMDTERN